MGVVAGLSVVAAPADALAINCEIFGDPENGIGQTFQLPLTELSVNQAS